MKSLEDVIHTLILNGTLTEQAGLYYGKTGIAIFFFHYARQTGNEIFLDYAMDLIEEVQKQISNKKVSLRYDAGLAGIGAGFAYILQNGFIEAEDDDCLIDFDKRMCYAAKYEQYPCMNLPEGLTGLGRYLIYRVHSSGQKNKDLHEALTYITNEITKKIHQNCILENEQPDVYRFFHDLTKLPEYKNVYSVYLQKCLEWKSISEPDIQKIFPYMGNLQRLYICQKYFNMNLSEKIENEWKKWYETDNSILTDNGFLNGWAAEGLLHLTFIDKLNEPWINLL